MAHVSDNRLLLYRYQSKSSAASRQSRMPDFREHSDEPSSLTKFSFLSHHATEVWQTVVQLHSFLTLAGHGGQLSISGSNSCYHHGHSIRRPLHRTLGEPHPQPVWTRCLILKFVPCPGVESRPHRLTTEVTETKSLCCPQSDLAGAQRQL
jgi:hypothetical protein